MAFNRKNLLKKFKRHLRTIKIVGFLVFLTIAIVTTLVLVQHEQDNRQEAYGSWNFFKNYQYKGWLPTSTPGTTRRPTVTPYTRPTATPAIRRPIATPTAARICTPNSYQGGTYCTSPYSCYDVYCNSTGTAKYNVTYSGSQCSHCNVGPTPQPTKPPTVCTPKSYIGGTYCETSTRCYDVYCNSTGTGSSRTYYSGASCSHCAN